MSSTISPKDTLLQRAKCIKSISPAFTVHADRKSNLQGCFTPKNSDKHTVKHCECLIRAYFSSDSFNER